MCQHHTKSNEDTSSCVRSEMYLKCSAKASIDRFCAGNRSRSRSSIFARFRRLTRSSKLFSTRYSLNASVTKNRTVPFAINVSLSSAENIVSGGSPESFCENVSAVKMANFLRSSGPYNSCQMPPCQISHGTTIHTVPHPHLHSTSIWTHDLHTTQGDQHVHVPFLFTTKRSPSKLYNIKLS